MQKIKDNIAFILALVVMVLILLKCNHKPKPAIVSTKDTITITKVFHDTIVIKETNVVYKPKPYKVYVSDTIDNGLDSIRLYKNTYDKFGGTISVTDSVRGKLLSNKLEINFKIPKDCVVVTNNITKHDTIIKHPKFQGFWVGLETGGNKTSFNSISPYLLVSYKNKQIGYSYNILNNTHNIRVGVKIF